MSVEQLDSVKQKIVDALREHRSEGMTPREVAKMVKLSIVDATAHMRALRQRGFAMKDPGRSQRNGQIIWFTDEEGLQQLNSRFRMKMRKCLGGCGKEFESMHAGNRICPKCSSDETEDMGMVA